VSQFRAPRLAHEDSETVTVAIGHCFDPPRDRFCRVPGGKHQLAEFHRQAPLGGGEVHQRDFAFHQDWMTKLPNQALEVTLEVDQNFGLGRDGHGSRASL